MTVAVIDYQSGNLCSVAKALERVGGDVRVTASPAMIRTADQIVLPGVGAFADCRRGLAAVPDLLDTLATEVLQRGKPFLGICVGMQLLATTGLEDGTTAGLGWLPGVVGPLQPTDPALKIPHMGWNTLTQVARHPVLKGIDMGSHVYFVHSYHLTPDDPAQVLATTLYGQPVTAVAGQGSCIGTQFHPEKSQAVGLRILQNFLEWRP
jgi:imidazole glycerol-phosphate synthase subunit HisH